MASIYNSRKFNLVPPPSKEEVVVIQERDNSFFYSFILIFCAVVVFFFLTLAQTLVIQPRIASEKTNLDNLNAQVSTFDSLKNLHGELFIKSQSLETILVQDIKLTQLLSISDQLKKDIPDILVTSYSRETTGQFVVDFRVDNISDVNTIFSNSESIIVLKGLNLKSVAQEQFAGSTFYIVEVGFSITNITN